MKTLTIIGAGMMGSAISFPARDNGLAVRIVGTPLDREIITYARAHQAHLTMKRPLPPGVSFYQIEELAEAVEGADGILCGVSSFGVDWFSEAVMPKLPQGLPVLSITKGLLDLPDGTLQTFPQVLQERWGQAHSFSAVGGPCTSYELADRRHSAVAFCGEDREGLRRWKEWLQTPYYHISLSTDVIGVECAVAMKNAYALAVSLAIGLQQREAGCEAPEAYNPQAALFGQSVREMRRMIALVGGGPENIVYAAGDLYVTIFGGRTRRLGILLGKGHSFEEAMDQLNGVTLESVVIARRTVRAMEALAKRGQARAEDFPLLFHVGRLLAGERELPIPWAQFESEA